jgi:transposase
MFLPSTRLKFYLYTHPTDMRKSFNGLFGIVSNALSSDPLSGDVYVFINKRKDRLKLLFWDKGGFWISTSVLKKGLSSDLFPAQTRALLIYPTRNL